MAQRARASRQADCGGPGPNPGLLRLCGWSSLVPATGRTRGGQDRGPVDRPQGARPEGNLAVRDSGCRSAFQGACGRDRSPGSEAVQHHGHRGRPGEDSRLRPRRWRRFQHMADLKVELEEVKEAGAPAKNFISSTLLHYNPQFSPDGKRIAFGSNRSGGLCCSLSTSRSTRI